MNPMGMKERLKRRMALLLTYAMTITSLLTGLGPVPVFAAGSSSSDFTIASPDYGVTLGDNCFVRQGDHILTSGEDIDATEAIEVGVYINIPNKTQHEVYPEADDVITINLPAGYSLVGSLTSRKAIHKENKEDKETVCYIEPYAEGDTSVKVSFTDVTLEYIDISAYFHFFMEYGDTDSIDSTEGKVTTLFEKDFTLRVPGNTDGFALKKSGSINADTITWTVHVTAPDDIDYGGYTFVDDLEDGLEYIDDSFKVNGVAADGVEGNIEYTFPAGTKGNKTITFNTRINDGTVGRKYDNVAGLYDEQELKAEDDATVEVPDNPLTKDYKNYHTNASGNPECDWILSVDPQKLGGTIKHCKVVDYLGYGWNVKEVSISDAEDGDYIETENYEKEERESDTKLIVNLGDVSSVTFVKITTELPKGLPQYRNKALMEYDGGMRTLPIHKTINLDNKGLYKYNNGYNIQTHEIEWTVEIEENPSSEAKYTLDMIIDIDPETYSSYAWRKSSEWDEGMTFIGPSDNDVWWNVGGGAQSFGQHYIPGSFEANSASDKIRHGLMEVYDPESGVVVGHVLVVESTEGYLASDEEVKYSYKTEVSDPSVYAGNGYVDNGESVEVTNEVILTKVDGTVISREGDAVNVEPKMLVKDKMTRKVLS
ncbi:MAG: isopeptide-forming domain-containing fimbrial protein, partial [Lachnospiraceae bacterium]|nr:isopeptide-forming domain-containing fimbrial protein [Lachnospiraceae bacterium]